MTDSLDAVLTENQSLYQKVQALTAENKRLREALSSIVKSDENTWKKYPQSKGIYSYYADIAIKALEKTK